MNHTKYFLYARKSSESEERQVKSIEDQFSELEEFNVKEKLKITEVFQESKSAKIPGRKEFNKMMEKIKASKEPIGILAWHPDRLARNSVDGGQIIYMIDIGQICSLKFPSFWFEPTPQGIFSLNMAFSQSKYYSDNLSENVKRGIRQKLRRGDFSGQAPFGYLNNLKTRNIEPDPVNSKVIQKIFTEFSQGFYSLQSARYMLSDYNVNCGNGKPYSISMVQRMLTNQTYLGVIKHKGEFHEGNFKPLVNKETFDLVQRRLNERSKPRKNTKMHDFPFRSLFKCAECGGQITAQFAKGKSGGIYRYYRCTKKLGPCKQGYLREDLMANQLREFFMGISISQECADFMLNKIDLLQKSNHTDSKIFQQSIENKQQKIDEKMSMLVNAYLDKDIEREIYLIKKNELVKEKSDLLIKKSESGERVKSRLEPFKEWVKTSLNMRLLASPDSSYMEIKEGVEKIGSNSKMGGKKIVVDLVEPYHLMSKHRSLQGEEIKNPRMNQGLNEVEKGANPLWCGRRDSNPHTFRRQILSLVRLPISPRPHSYIN
jgi:site-specific DNA recombinase